MKTRLVALAGTVLARIVARRLVVTIALALLLVAAPAAGASVSYVSAFGSSGSGSGQFNSPYGVAVDSVGNVYVADTFNERIDKFDSSGSFVEAWGWGVNGGVGFETCTISCQAGTSGGGAGQLNSPTSIAIDSSDDLFVADTANHRVDEFTSSGGFTETWGWGVNGGSGFETCTSSCHAGTSGGGAGQMGSPYGVAVDGSSVYVSDESRVDKFSLTGTFVEAWGWGVSDGGSSFESCTSTCQAGIDGGGAGQLDSALGIATGSGGVYVADGGNNRIDEFSAAGAFVRAWGWGVSDGGASFETCTASCQTGTSGGHEGEMNDPFGIATDSSGNVYVGDSFNERIDEFTSTGTFVVTWGWGVSDDSSQFETCTSGCFSGQSGSGDGQFDTPQGVAVHGSTVYVADYNNSRIEQFSNPTATVDVTTGSTHSVTTSGAVVTGLVNPHGTDASYWFDYGTGTGYGRQTPTDDAGSDDGFVAEAALSGLDPGTTYHYRISAQQGASAPVHGADRTFTVDGPRAPAATTGGTSSVGATVATLLGTISANEADTTYHFDIGKSTTAFTSVGATDIGTANGYAASFDATGLDPASTYDYRVVAHNSQGDTVGDWKTFTTAQPVDPTVTVGDATIDGASATLSATVNTFGHAGTVSFVVTWQTPTCGVNSSGSEELDWKGDMEVGGSQNLAAVGTPQNVSAQFSAPGASIVGYTVAATLDNGHSAQGSGASFTLAGGPSTAPTQTLPVENLTSKSVTLVGQAANKVPWLPATADWSVNGADFLGDSIAPNFCGSRYTKTMTGLTPGTAYTATFVVRRDDQPQCWTDTDVWGNQQHNCYDSYPDDDVAPNSVSFTASTVSVGKAGTFRANGAHVTLDQKCLTQAACDGTAVVAMLSQGSLSAAAARPKAPHVVVVAQGHFHIRSHSSRHITLRTTAKARRLLRHRRTVKAMVLLRVRSGHRKPIESEQTVHLRRR